MRLSDRGRWKGRCKSPRRTIAVVFARITPAVDSTLLLSDLLLLLHIVATLILCTASPAMRRSYTPWRDAPCSLKTPLGQLAAVIDIAQFCGQWCAWRDPSDLVPMGTLHFRETTPYLPGQAAGSIDFFGHIVGKLAAIVVNRFTKTLRPGNDRMSKVLIVDDEPQYGVYLSDWLTREGHEVKTGDHSRRRHRLWHALAAQRAGGRLDADQPLGRLASVAGRARGEPTTANDLDHGLSFARVEGSCRAGQRFLLHRKALLLDRGGRRGAAGGQRRAHCLHRPRASRFAIADGQPSWPAMVCGVPATRPMWPLPRRMPSAFCAKTQTSPSRSWIASLPIST